MSNIVRRPKASEAAIQRMINSAPDGAPAKPAPAAPAKTIRKVGNQVAISLAMPPELLDQIDQAAAASNISRAAFIKHALSRAVSVEGN
jgi:hypothetical protein